MVFKSDGNVVNYMLLKEVFLWLDNGDRRMLQKYSLSTARFNVLCHLANHGPLSQSALGALLLCDKANVTKLLESMQADRLICRNRDPDDGRRVVVALTGAGRELWQKAAAAHQEFTEKRFQCLSSQEHEMLSTTLLSLLGSLKTQIVDGR